MALQTIKVRKLGEHGVITDLPSSETPISAWSDSRNIKFNNNRVSKSRGHIPIFYVNREESDATIYKDVKQVPMHIENHPNQADAWLYFSRNMVWMTNGWNHEKVWDDELDGEFSVYYETPWSTTVLSGSVIAYSPVLSKPIGMSATFDAGVFRPLHNWGPWTANTISSFKSFAFALGGGDEYPQRVRWSNITPPNSVPADWGWKYTYDSEDEAADPEHVAGTPVPSTDPLYGTFIDGSAGGYNDLSFARGKVIDGVALRDSFIIYTDEEVISCEYVGGNDIFRFRKLFEDGGALNINCVAEFNNQHFVVSPNDIYIHNGSTKESVITNKVRDVMLSHITETTFLSVNVIPYLTESEIWVLYPGTDAVSYDSKEGIYTSAIDDDKKKKEFTKAAVYNYNNKTWSFLDVPKTNTMKLGPVPVYAEDGSDVKNWEKIPENYIWEDGIELWNLSGGNAQNFKRHSLVCASSDGGFYVMDRGEYFTVLDGRDPKTWKWRMKRTEVTSDLSKYYIDMDDVTDTTLYKTVLEIWPQVEGSGELFIQIGGSHTSDGDPEWGTSVRFICGLDRKVDLRSNYRYLSLKIQSKGLGEWKLFGMDVVVRIGGRR